MSELITITIVKKSPNIKYQKWSNDKNYNGQDKKFKGNRNGKRNLRGPDANSYGPFWSGDPPIECYNCDGWGHKAHGCPSPLNFQKGEALKTRKGKETPPSKTTNAGQDNPSPDHPKQN